MNASNQTVPAEEEADVDPAKVREAGPPLDTRLGTVLNITCIISAFTFMGLVIA